ncbi:MAG: M20 family metallopeptidase [Chloroflexota bacterium]|nr:M20 family metallopeptidase [Chloroflexota bacterium]
MSDHNLIVSELAALVDQYLDDLRLFSGIDSGSYDKPGVDRVQSWFGERYRALGFDVERWPQEAWGDDLIARRRGEGIARILLIGHADTVYPPGTAAARPVTVDGDRILGPGTCDMKAGLLSGLYALGALEAISWQDYGLITVVIVSDEEIEQRHSVDLLREEGPKHHAVLTLEAARANGDIVTSRKASRWYRVEAVGRTAHAGVEPEKGASATLAIARIIDAAFALNGLKPGMTVNPGRIEGGANPNIVADRASVLFDLRAWSNAEMEELTGALRAAVEAPKVPGVTATMGLSGGPGMPAMERSAGTVRLEQHAIRIAGDLGFPLQGAATGGASDVSHAVHAGTPGLDGLGPIGGLDHSPDEYILRSSIVPRTALLAGLLQAIADDEELTHG